MKKIFPVVLIALFFSVSCDILRNSPFEVVSWSPGGGYHEKPESLKLSLLFSHECDKISVEQAFSLLEDGRSINGYFGWQGRQLIFTPASPLEKNKEYLVSLGTSAKDKDSLSLEWKFEESFSTRPHGGRLSVVSVFPSYNGIISDPRSSLDIVFSEAVSEKSCMSDISFSPSISGSWRLDDEGKTASFTPFDPWRHGSRYRINISSGFKDANGRSLGKEFTSIFTAAAGGDLEKPELLSAWAVNPDKTETELKETESFENWESFTVLRLDFSKPVDTSSVKSRLSAEPHEALVMETLSGFADSVSFRFAEKTAWNEHFAFHLQPGVSDSSGNESENEKNFVIKTGGEFSKPPSLVGIRLPMSPGADDDMELLDFSIDDLFEDLPIRSGEERYPYAAPVQTWIELYFETASESEVDPFSLMALFHVEATNGAASFSPRHIITGDFTHSEPAEKWAEYKRLEIRGVMTNTVNSGVVSFIISSGLEDTKGNKNPKAIRISLLK